MLATASAIRSAAVDSYGWEQCARIASSATSAWRALAGHLEGRPGFFARLFRTAGFQRWAEIHQPLAAEDLHLE